MLCGVDHGRHGAEEGGKRLAAEQVGMQPLPARYADEWVVRVQVVGAGQRGGGNLLRHFYTSRGGHKSGKVMSFIVTHKRGPSNPFNQHNDEWWGKERCRGVKRNLNNI